MASSLLHQSTAGARVLLLGDSLAQGLGPPLARLADAAGVPFVARGIQSSTIRQWLTGSALLDAVTQADPTLTLVSLGTNDMRAADPGAEGRRSLEIINALLRNGSAVAWIGPPSVPIDKSAFRAALAAACGQRGVRIFDSQALDLERAPDRLHPTPAGYRAWAESIAVWLPLVDLGLGPVLATPAPPRDAPVDTSTTLGERAAGLPARHLALRDRLVVAGLGELDLDDYAARVVTAELGGSRQLEALKAQAIAARTYVQHALHDDPALGTAAKPVRNGQDFQVAAAVATALPRRAAEETRGGVAFYRGRLILANYVAGAPWAPGAWKGTASPTYPTEKYVTYNEGRVGASVLPTQQANRRHTDNRGTLSQNGADALAARGWTWPRILRFFYGDDLQFTVPEPAEPALPAAARAPKSPPHTPPPSAPQKPGADNGPLLLAAALTTYRLLG